ncbi:MAG: hypothetical protein KME17_30025 [Cyanosarcina radialis HA8281-LM2]|jgi:hypothetical protein|nr:hypothetical protein [Cyanosarcina radialis HA8281-LM2]
MSKRHLSPLSQGRGVGGEGSNGWYENRIWYNLKSVMWDLQTLQIANWQLFRSPIVEDRKNTSCKSEKIIVGTVETVKTHTY